MDGLTIIIPYFNGGKHIGRLLDGIPSDVPVIVVDDQSDVPFQSSLPNVTVYRPDEKLYFTGAVNYAIERCSTDVLILNQDIELSGTGWLDLIADNRDRYALIGERITGDHPAFPHGYVHGVFQFMRRDAIEVEGMMDAEMYPLWGASAQWQWSICRAGYESLPVQTIPGLTHHRKGGTGDSIRLLLKQEPENVDTLIRTPPEVSVVVPNYNQAKYILDLLDSLWAQTFQSFEVVIVDDGSGVEDVAILSSIAAQNRWHGARVLHHNSNLGTPSALNTGIEAACGKYICVTCADDMREPWSLADLYAAQLEHPFEFIYDDPVIYTDKQRKFVMELGDYNFEKLLNKNHVHVGIMYPKQAWKDAGGYPEVMRQGREDWAFNIALGRAGWCGHKIGRSGYLYRREGQNRTEYNTTPEWMTKFAHQLRNLYPDLYRGERPMGCCGSKTSAPRGERPTPPVGLQAPPPAGEMVLMEYLGRNAGTTMWGGPGAAPSGQMYRFGATANHREKYVFTADVEYMESLRENGVNIFQVVETAETPTAVPPPHIEVPDPGEMTVAEIKKIALSVTGWTELLEAEKAGKARRSVLKYAGDMAHIDA